MLTSTYRLVGLVHTHICELTSSSSVYSPKKKREREKKPDTGLFIRKFGAVRVGHFVRRPSCSPSSSSLVYKKENLMLM